MSVKGHKRTHACYKIGEIQWSSSAAADTTQRLRAVPYSVGASFTQAYEAASEHNPSLCSNLRLDASPPLRGRWRRKAAQMKAPQSQVHP
jgi:hypothetical protein